MRLGVIMHQEEPRTHCTTVVWQCFQGFHPGTWWQSVPLPAGLCIAPFLLVPGQLWKQSCWMMLQVAECSPHLLQTLWCLSHVLGVNLPILQSARQGPSRGCWALMPPHELSDTDFSQMRTSGKEMSDHPSCLGGLSHCCLSSAPYVNYINNSSWNWLTNSSSTLTRLISQKITWLDEKGFSINFLGTLY